MITLEALLITKIGLELPGMGLPIHVLNARKETQSSCAAKYRRKSMIVFLISTIVSLSCELRKMKTNVMGTLL